MLAQMVGQRTSELFQFLRQNSLDVGFAAATAGTGLGACLHSSEGGAFDSEHGIGIGNISMGNIVTGADLDIGIGGYFLRDNFTTGRVGGKEHGEIFGEICASDG